MSYYRKFKIVIGSPLWRIFIHWAYNKCLDDFSKLSFSPNFNKKEFTALLCGVGNEVTADEFIKFVLERNKKAKIIIIDLGKEQIEAIKKLINNKYLSVDINVKQINALELNSFIRNESIDWIETDGFLEYFDTPRVNELLQIWSLILKPKGFITLREPASSGFIGNLIDYSRKLVGKKWLSVILYIHTKNQLEKLFNKHNFKFVSGTTYVPTFTRFSMIKKV